jgi:hypothetical protein
MILLSGGALLAHSFSNLEKQSFGMSAENIVTAAISLGQKSYPRSEIQMAFFQRLERNLRYGPVFLPLFSKLSNMLGTPRKSGHFWRLFVGQLPASGSCQSVAQVWEPDAYEKL